MARHAHGTQARHAHGTQARVPLGGSVRAQQGTGLPPQPRLEIGIKEVQTRLEQKKVTQQAPQPQLDTLPLFRSPLKNQQAVVAQAKQLGLSPEQLRAKLEGLLLLLPDVAESTMLSLEAQDLQDLMSDTSAVASRLVEAISAPPTRIPGGGPLQGEDAARFLWQHPQLLSSRHWDSLHSSRPVARLQESDWLISSVAIAPDGRQAVSGSGPTLRVWDLQACTCTGALCSPWVNAVAISPDGRHVLSSAADFDNFSIRLWDLQAQACVAATHGRPLTSAMAITPDGCHVVTVGRERSLQVLDLQSLKCVTKLRAGLASGPICSVIISPDGRLALVGSADDVDVWDLQERGHTARLRGDEGGVAAVAISPQGRHAVSGCEDRTLRVWDLQASTCVGILRGHAEAVTAVAITPDGRHAVSGSEDCTLRVWDLQALACVATLWGHTEGVTCLAISPDGRQAVSGGRDGSLLVWALQPHTGGRSTVPLAP